MNDAGNPLVTFILIAFNQENYILDAVSAAFAQTYSPLQIILSDDCSTDRTFELMSGAAAAYKGPHRVVLNRNPKNLNIGDHINVAAGLAEGDLLVMAAGDDVSKPERTQILVDRWNDLCRTTVVLFSDFDAMNSASQVIESFRERISQGPFDLAKMAGGDIRVLGATAAVSRAVFQDFPPLDPSVRHEDRVLPFRALLKGGAVDVINRKLICYRVEGGMSRSKVVNARAYLFDHIPALMKRTIPDAEQRLKDLLAIAPQNQHIEKICRSTIILQVSQLAIAVGRGLRPEVALIHGAKNSVPLGPLIRLLVKRRFLWIYEIYYRFNSLRSIL